MLSLDGLACAHSCMDSIMSGSAQQHSQTDMLIVCQFSINCFAIPSPLRMLCRESREKSTSSVLANVRARSFGDVAPR